MKPIQVESSHDSIVSVQVSKTQITDHTGTRQGPDEICLMITDEKGDHVAMFSPWQAIDLMQVLLGAIRQITGKKTTVN